MVFSTTLPKGHYHLDGKVVAIVPPKWYQKFNAWLLWGISLAVAYLLDYLAPSHALKLVLPGMFLFFAGTIWSILAHFQRKVSAPGHEIYDVPTRLLTRGFYGWTRHPQYLGMLISTCGWCLVLGSPQAFLALIVLSFHFMRNCVPREETILRICYSYHYIRYLGETPRWL